MCDTPVIKNTPYTLLITCVDGNERPARPRAAFMPCHMRTMAQLWLVATAMALSNPSFAAGAACFQRGELSAARRHFEESKRLFPDDAATVAVLTRLDELGVKSGASYANEAVLQESSLRLCDGKHTIRVLTPTDEWHGSSAGDASGK